MPSDKAAYLAAHYLSTDTKPSSSTKKRKRKPAAASSGLLITDDDETGWGASTTPKDAAADDDAPVAIAGTSSEFRRAKKSAWKSLSGTPTTTTPTPTTTDDPSTAAAADAIIASAAAESAAAAAAEAADDLLPPNATPNPDTPLMSNGALPGLQSASALTAQLRARQKLEQEELAQLRAAAAANDQTQQGGEDEIILRDATGRRVDASMRRAEARRLAAEAERAALAKQTLQRGEVQAAQARERRERLEEAAVMPLARGVDDAEMNAEMKAAERWNDPMAEFLSGPTATKGKNKKGVGRRPVYPGAGAPNRYGIRPGYRWDGVDRGNGFEAERFKAINRRERNKGLEYAWQMDE